MIRTGNLVSMRNPSHRLTVTGVQLLTENTTTMIARATQNAVRKNCMRCLMSALPETELMRFCTCMPVLDVAIANRDQCSPKTRRSEEHTSELQSLMRISYAVFCLKKTYTQQI